MKIKLPYKYLLIIGVLLGGLLVINLAASKNHESAAPAAPTGFKVATFAGGCFWCTESDFEKLPGVHEVISGFSGGKEVNPQYKDVARGLTGHIESVQVHYNPKVISYEGLLQSLWRQIDPTDGGGQFVDRGSQYRPAVFFHNAEEKALAQASLAQLAASGRYNKPMAVELIAFDSFYPANDDHQDYHEKNPLRYKYYRYGSGRDQYLEATWGKDLQHDYRQYSQNPYQKPTVAELKKRLSPLQFKVTQLDDTERPFDNPYWNEKRAGIYVDIVSGEPLFSSLDKYDSKTGWPSFTQPIPGVALAKKTDRKLFIKRIEVRSALADSHLGHVFEDGPEPTGLRYCINSAALKFIPKTELEAEGYAQFVPLFQ